MRAVQAALHAHIQAGVESQLRGFTVVAGVAMRDQFEIGGVIGHHEATEFPFVAQDHRHQLVVGRSRHAIDVVEGTHDGQRAGIQRRLERWQVHVAQRAFGNLHAVVVQPAHDSAIGCEMLGRGEESVRRFQVIALEALHAGGGKRTAQEHVFTRGFGHAAPALVAGHVHGGGEGPVQAGGGGFDGGSACGAACQVRFEAGGFTQRDREHGAHAVDDIRTKQQRNAQAGFFHRHALRLASQRRTHAIEQGTGTATAHQLQGLRSRLLVHFGIYPRREGPQHVGKNAQLAHLLFQRHPRQQRFQAIIQPHYPPDVNVFMEGL